MAENKLIPLPEFNELGVREGNDIICLSPWLSESEMDNQEIDTTPLRLLRENTHVNRVNDDDSLLDFCCPESVGEPDSELNEDERIFIEQIFFQNTFSTFKCLWNGSNRGSQ
jgi:hypothetical protein